MDKGIINQSLIPLLKKTHKINETCVFTDFDQYVCVTMTLTVTFKLPDFFLLAVQDINKLKFTLNL